MATDGRTASQRESNSALTGGSRAYAIRAKTECVECPAVYVEHCNVGGPILLGAAGDRNVRNVRPGALQPCGTGRRFRGSV